MLAAQLGDGSSHGDGAAHWDGVLRDCAERALRRTVRVRSRRDDGVCELMRRTCNVARARGLRVEQLLIVLKHVWRELPEALTLPHAEADMLLARAITVCIEEYYARSGRGD